MVVDLRPSPINTRKLARLEWVPEGRRLLLRYACKKGIRRARNTQNRPATQLAGWHDGSRPLKSCRSHDGARLLKRRPLRMRQADSTEGEWQIWTAICWLPAAQPGRVASVAKIGADDTFAQGLGGGARARPSHTDLKPVDDSREKAGAAGDARPCLEHR